MSTPTKPSWRKVRSGDVVRVKLEMPCDGIGSEIVGTVAAKRGGRVAVMLEDFRIVDAFIGEDELLEHTVMRRAPRRGDDGTT